MRRMWLKEIGYDKMIASITIKKRVVDQYETV